MLKLHGHAFPAVGGGWLRGGHLLPLYSPIATRLVRWLSRKALAFASAPYPGRQAPNLIAAAPALGSASFGSDARRGEPSSLSRRESIRRSWLVIRQLGDRGQKSDKCTLGSSVRHPGRMAAADVSHDFRPVRRGYCRPDLGHRPPLARYRVSSRSTRSWT